MTPIPESGLDYLILSKEDAIALHDYFLHQYVHYDNEAAHAAVTKLDKFVERVEKNESSKANRMGSGENRETDEQLPIG
jgi:hypothetical protein